MILPAVHQMKIIAGATFDFRFEYLVADQANPTPVDLSGYSAQWTLTSMDGLNTVLAQYNSGGIYGTSGVFFGGDLHTPTNGVIDLVITASDTCNLGWTTAQYVLTVTPPSLIVVPLLRGNMIVTSALP